MNGRLQIKAGRRFGCTECGACCLEPGYVYMSTAELTAMAEHLEMSLVRFREKYGVVWDAAPEEWFVNAMHGMGCPLLLPDGGCSVHPVKPTQCRSFPFWDEMLDEAREWEEAKSFCPGLDATDGRLYPQVEIRAICAGKRST